MSSFILEVFPGGYDLPTIDFDCLIAVTYCCFAQVPVKVVERSTIYFSSLPALICDGDGQAQKQRKVIGSNKIIEYLNSLDYKLEIEGRKDIRLDINSFISMFEDKLHSCLNYLWWYDLDSYNTFFRGCYAKRLAFPANFFVPGRIRKANIEKLRLKYTPQVLERDSIGKILENDVINQARYCLNLIVPDLKGKAFFYDSHRPTLLDVHLFAYLALFYKIPCKNQTIKHHIGASKNFVEYIEHVCKNYLGKFKSSSTASSSPFDSMSDYDGNSIKWQDLFLSTSLAATLMLIYAFYK